MPFCTTCGSSVNGAFCTKCGTPVSAATGAAQPQPAASPNVTSPSAAPPPEATAPPFGPPGPGAPPPPIAGRKTNPLVWVGVVILGLFVLGALAAVGTGIFVLHKVRQAGVDPDLFQRNPGLALTKLMAAVNPDVEVMKIDDGAGRITIRDRRTGKVMTMSFDDARNGRFSFSAQDDNGRTATMQFGGSAGHLPAWIPAYPGSSPRVNLSAQADGGEGGNFSFTTSDPPSKVMQFYQEKFKEMNLQTTVDASTNSSGMLTGVDESQNRSLTVVVDGSSGSTGVIVTYGRK